MKEPKNEFHTIDAYIALFPTKVQKILEEMRAVIKTAAPEAEEKISYQMPTFAQKGNLVHFAAHKNHIGFYPNPSGIDKFRAELTEYETSKGAIQFPYGKPIPYDLVRRIVAFRVRENLEKAEAKKRR
ncbi:MAG: hypothetical protein GYA45_12090 [Pelolinea sp.]|jgi:uncharacterized protein YdhG (YjbR/CyaY superfamily)|nr:hypothetical protein [Pelolinea sp.]